MEVDSEQLEAFGIKGPKPKCTPDGVDVDVPVCDLDTSGLPSGTPPSGNSDTFSVC